jgi:hypothetical protein
MLHHMSNLSHRPRDKSSALLLAQNYLLELILSCNHTNIRQFLDFYAFLVSRKRPSSNENQNKVVSVCADFFGTY